MLNNLWIFIGSLLILIISYCMFESYISFIIAFYISFLVSLFVNNNYKYSELFIIRLLRNQIFAVNFLKFIIFLIVFLYILYYFDLITQIFADGGDIVDGSNSNINKTNNSSNNSNKDDVIVTSKVVVDKTAEVVTNVITDSLGKMIEGVTTAAGAGSAAGVVGAKIVSSMGKTPLGKRIVAGVTAATLTAGGVSGAIKTVNSLAMNKYLHSATASHTQGNIDSVANTSTKTRSNSPIEDFIHSVLESNEIISPLENLLDCQIYFGALMLISISGIIMILCLWMYNKYNIILIKYIIGTNLGNKIMGKFVNLNFIKNMNDRFLLSFLFIYIMVLIFCLLFQIYIAVELRVNLVEYIEVYNIIKKAG